MLVVILVIGAGLLGPNEGRLTGLAEGGDQGEYDTILRRVKLGTGFLSFLIIAATFMMVARVPESNEAGSVDEAALVGAKIFVGSGCGSCHTLAAAHTDGNRRTEPRRRGGGSERGRRSRRDRRSPGGAVQRRRALCVGAVRGASGPQRNPRALGSRDGRSLMMRFLELD
jgi:hypothetical protein